MAGCDFIAEPVGRETTYQAFTADDTESAQTLFRAFSGAT
jgi:hypothetical protein